jgi:hypothetical protein
MDPEPEREEDEEASERWLGPWTPAQVEELVLQARLERYHRGLPCGADALHRYLDEVRGLRPLPSVRQIGRLLTLYGMTHGRTGWDEGEALPADLPPSAWVPPAQRRSLPPVNWGPR